MPAVGFTILSYMRERSPLPMLAGLSLIMFLAGLPWLPVEFLDALRGWLSMLVFLLLIRLNDDIADIPIDRITHPQRLLCRAGPDELRGINRFRAGAAVFLLLLQLPRMDALLFVLLTIAGYGVFFALKSKFSIIAQTIVLNSSLAVFPIYGELLLSGGISAFGGLMGLFFWLGGLAHDYSHCLLDTRAVEPATLNPINRIDQRRLAGWSMVLFAASGSAGVLLFCLGLTGPLFLVGLLGCGAALLYLAPPLVRHPSRATARHFYWFGFVFFLAPALGHLLEMGWTYLA